MAAVAGLRGSGDWAADERPKDFRSMILWRNPNGDAPLTALLSRAAKDKPADPEFFWWDEPNDIVRLQTATTVNSTATTLTVDSEDPDETNPGRVWGHATHLKEGDLLLVEKTETAAYDNELVMVSSVTSSTSFTVKRGVAGTTPAAINEDTFLTHIGSAYAEGTGAPPAASRNPLKYSNMCQIFKDIYDITNTAKGITNLRTGDVLKNEKMRKAFDHARGIEQAIMWGQKHEDTGPNGKPRRFTGGIRSFIPANRTTIFTTTPTVNTFLDSVYPAFDFNTPAGDQRVVFCGNGALNSINKMAKEDGQIQFDEVVKVYGMNLRRYILPQGELYLRTHPLFNRHGRFAYSMVGVDFSALRWRPFRDTKTKDNIQNNDEDRSAGQWLTEAGLEVRYGGLSLFYLGNVVV